jgi:hypothetical protein
MIPRPARNNNPGDLVSGPPWIGLVPPAKMTAEQKAEPRFAVFESPEYGFRALALLLHNYQRIFDCATIQDMIRRFAPPKENPTDTYAAHVAWECGAGVAEPYNLDEPGKLTNLCKAIARFETGCWAPYWNDKQLNAGVAMAVPHPPAQVAAQQQGDSEWQNRLALR